MKDEELLAEITTLLMTINNKKSLMNILAVIKHELKKQKD